MIQPTARTEMIEATIRDLVSDFLYYDRKADEGLPRGEIEEAVEHGEITADDIVRVFSTELHKYLKSLGVKS